MTTEQHDDTAATLRALVQERDAARGEAARMRETARALLFMAAHREYGIKVADYLLRHLQWPGDGPQFAHNTMEEARAALSGEPAA